MKRSKETYSDWRLELRELFGAGTAPMTAPDMNVATNQSPKKDTDAAKEIKDKKVNNKVVINPPMKEAFEEIGGVVLSLHEEQLTKQELEKMQDDKDRKEARKPDSKPEVKEDLGMLQQQRAKKEVQTAKIDMKIAKERTKASRDKKTSMQDTEAQQVKEVLDMKKSDMGDVVKDFYKSDAPQFKGKSKKKRREMAIAAKLNAEEMSVADQLRVSQEYFKKRAARSPEEKKSEKERHIKSRAANYAKHKIPDPYKSRAGESD